MLAVCKAVGVESASVPRMASGFGGGIAGQGEACGALTGGMMALGLLHGRDNADDPDGKTALSDKSKQLVARFQAANSAIRCADITGLDLRTEEGRQAFGDKNMHDNRCNSVVSNAVSVLLTLLNEWEADSTQ